MPAVKLAGRLRRNWPVALAVLLLAAAVWLPPVDVPRDTWRYMITIDVTQSMDVEDTGDPKAPASRLAAARAAVREALRRMPCGSEVGLAVFADYRALPLLLPVEVCANYDALLAAVDGIDSRMAWLNASNITKGLYWILRMAHTLGHDTRIVFITDGHESPPLRPSEHSILNVTPGEVEGWLAGVGGDIPVPIPRSDTEGNRTGYWKADDVVQLDAMQPNVPRGQSHEELSSLHEAHLESLAKQTGLGYRRLSRPEVLADAMLASRLAHRQAVRTDVRWVPALLALVLLAGVFLPDALRPWRWRFVRRVFRRGRPAASPDSTPLPTGVRLGP